MGCPTYEGKAYCLSQYLEGVRRLTYPGLSFLLVDNSRTDAYSHHLAALHIPVKKIPFTSDPRDRVTDSRNVLREVVLTGGYDYFFSLEQDIVPEPAIIEKMLAHGKDIVAAPYCVFHVIDGKQVLVPVVYDIHPHNKEGLWYLPKEELAKSQLKKVKAFGLGCVLISRVVLEKISFHHAQGYDDMLFSKDAIDMGFNLYLDTTLQVTHMLLHPK